MNGRLLLFNALDMKKAFDNPSLGIKVIDVREADEYEIAKVDGVPLLP